MRALIASGGGAADLAIGTDAATTRAGRRAGPPDRGGHLHLDRALALADTPFPLPLSIGHECVAEVLEVGSEVANVQVGDRVVVPFEINCGRCGACRAGFTSNCAGVPPLSMYGFGVGGGHWCGVLADQVAVPFADAMLMPLPEGVDPVAAASVADTIGDAYRHIAPHLPGLLRRDPDTEVLIIACLGGRTIYSASVPLYAGLIARALGARRVRLVDGRADVRAVAAGFGLEPVHRARCAPHRRRRWSWRRAPPRAGLWAALSHTAADGVCSSLGGLHRTARIPMMQLYARNISFHVGRTDVRALAPSVLELIAGGRFQPERVISTRGALDDGPGCSVRTTAPATSRPC
jgi:alcohol dehydrogenase